MVELVTMTKSAMDGIVIAMTEEKGENSLFDNSIIPCLFRNRSGNEELEEGEEADDYKDDNRNRRKMVN